MATEKLMTAEELAEYLSVSISTVRRLTRDGQIPVVRVRDLPRYDPEAVAEALSTEAAAVSRRAEPRPRQPLPPPRPRLSDCIPRTGR